MAENDEIREIEETGDGDGDGDGGDDALPHIEKKYQLQMRQIVSQKIDLPISTLPSMLQEQIKLNPEFQRRDRWDEARQSRLIESLVMNVPIPPVFLGEDEYGHYVVLDGRQRLTAVSKFLSNELKLKGLEVWDELNGMTYQDLVRRQQEKYFTRRFLQAVVLLKESSSIVKYDVFDRLNTGGVQANDMEIRNAVLRGKFTDLLHELSRTTEFCRLWGIPEDKIDAEANNIYKQMKDLEIVLRFFALYDHDGMTVRFKDYLSDFMEGRNLAYKNSPDLERSDRDRFLRAVKNCWRIFGDQAFVRPITRQRSVPLADAIMIALADYEMDKLNERTANLARICVQQLFHNEEFQRAIGTGTNGRGAIESRIRIARDEIAKAFI